jgi:serpin B
MKERRGTVIIPRFKTEYGVELKETLSSMGMDIALDPQKADFYGMLQNDPKDAFSSKVSNTRHLLVLMKKERKQRLSLPLKWL